LPFREQINQQNRMPLELPLLQHLARRRLLFKQIGVNH
jgi:hypothetical protein